MAVDSKGNIYTGDIIGKRLQKFVRFGPNESPATSTEKDSKDEKTTESDSASNNKKDRKDSGDRAKNRKK